MSFLDPASTLEGVFEEWLATNLFGGYASSTVGLVNTRTYHGLLTSASMTGGSRVQLVNSLEEKVVFGGEEYYLSTHRYLDVFYPDGLRHLVGFGQTGGTLWWAFKLGSSILLKRYSFEREGEGFTVEYSSHEPFELEVRPLLSFRTHHGVVRAGQRVFETSQWADGSVSIRVAGLPPTLRLKMVGGGFERGELWYYNFFYAEEAERGGPCVEDLYSPGIFAGRGVGLSLKAWVEPQKKVAYRGAETPLSSYLAFNPYPLVVAGYHWFWDWCRDTMVFLPTFFKETGDAPLVERVLERYFGAMVGGFMPTGFGEDGRPFYTSVDSSLWAAYAVGRICEHASSWSLAHRFEKRLREVFDGYRDGSMLGVGFFEGLLFHEAKGATWMDAQHEGVYYTPRDGFAVEVNALWLLLLKLLRGLAASSVDREALEEEVLRFKASFNRRFKSPFGLYDTLNRGFEPVDPWEIRPNMLFALSLHRDLVDEETGKRVLETVRRELLTPYGLRTLNPGHPKYRPKCVGDKPSRDAAYHNGTVWPWLVGAYHDACANYDPRSLPYFGRAITPLLRLAEARGYLLWEIFDGQPPHTPRGCLAQAWSASETLRVAESLARPEAVGGSKG